MPDHKEAFQQAFINDPEMQALADLIIAGWPKDIKEVPCPLHPYWQHRETITTPPPGQSNVNKVILLLKEMFSEHGICEVLCFDNGPQYASAQFTDFCISWGISHETSSLHYPQSNGFAEACIKSIKHAPHRAKYSGANPQLTLLGL